MGMNVVCCDVYGATVSDAFRQICDQADYDLGHDSYNGGINNCDLAGCIKRYETYSEKNEKEARKLLREHHVSKWEADYIDLGVVWYLVPEVKKTVEQYTAKFRQKYVVCDFCKKPVYIKTGNAFDTKTEADAVALSLAKRKFETFLVLKTMTAISGNETVTRIECEEKKVKKPTKKQAPDAVAIHKYIFIAGAPE